MEGSGREEKIGKKVIFYWGKRGKTFPFNLILAQL
jgi:hypothetical protein